MTGTASTEADEFMDIYKLDVLEIPTNVPVARRDLDDEVYRTAKEKWDAIIRDIENAQKRKQPVLVGTVSIEKSEMLAEMLKKRGIPHQVLNARYHEQEAVIIAQAGVPGAVTIATNMAGRGTDIQLGGNLQMRTLHGMRRPARGARARQEDRQLSRRRSSATARSCSTHRRRSSSSPPRTARPPRRSRSPAGCTSWEPSATRAGASTTSCAAGPAARAIPAAPSSTCRSKTT